MRWLRVALAWTGSRRTTPVVHPWMIRSSDAAWEAAGKLQVHRDWLTGAAATASELLDGDAGKGPWQERDQRRSPQAVALDIGHALGQAQTAFEGFAIAIDRYGPPLRELLRHSGRSQLERAGQTDVHVRAYTDALSTADATCRRALESAVYALPTTYQPTPSGLVPDPADARDAPASMPTPAVPAHPADHDQSSLAGLVAGHRRQLRAELAGLRRDDVAFERLATAHRQADSSQLWRRLTGQMTTAWLVRDGVGQSREDLRTRARLYESLLNDRVPDGDGDVRLRQVIEFDPAGAGRIAELWGPRPALAAAVAIFVPGTGTAMHGFHLPTEVARALASADPAGQTAVVAWMGADFPPAIGAHAIRSRYARTAAPRLCEHIAGLGIPGLTPVTLIGHSYGGPIVGAAECLGVRAERVIHLASAGAGPGVRSVRDYPRRDDGGRPRSVRRYSLRAPGDPVALARAVRVVTARRADLGVDPAQLDGVRVLPAGVFEADLPGHRRGEPLRGISGHAQVTMPGTTAFRLMVEIITGARLDPRPRLA
ncbi:MAG: alpha/beta hydrolase [Dermatophilaceae bacterium]